MVATLIFFDARLALWALLRIGQDPVRRLALVLALLLPHRQLGTGRRIVSLLPASSELVVQAVQATQFIDVVNHITSGIKSTVARMVTRSRTGISGQIQFVQRRLWELSTITCPILYVNRAELFHLRLNGVSDLMQFYALTN